MAKAKAKAKAKAQQFPAGSWAPQAEVYRYYPELFKYRDAMFGIQLDEPAREGDKLSQELDELLKKQENYNERKRRRVNIHSEAEEISRRYLKALLINAGSHPRTWFLVNAMSDVALVPVMYYKDKFRRPRPNQIDPRIEPMIEVPGHPAYPSGHATQNFLMAHALSEVIGDNAELIARVFSIARDVAVNREWAGVHYRSDTEAGERLARELFPIVREVFKEPIRDAVLEWQEISLEQVYQTLHVQAQVSTAGGPYPGSLFHEQWHLDNSGEKGGRAGVDIKVRQAWDRLGLWPSAPGRLGEISSQPVGQPPIRVVLLDTAVDLEHPALLRNLDRGEQSTARNLDYPAVAKEPWKEYAAAFRSASSAHGTACAGVIAASEYKDGCLGIAPTCRIVPFRAMTLTEPILQQRRAVADAILGIFEPGFAYDERVGDILLCPLPFDPLPPEAGEEDPLAFALAFAATRIPVIVPSGNKGSSSLSYPADLAEPESLAKYVKKSGGLGALATLLGWDVPKTKKKFGLESDTDAGDLYDRMMKEAGLIAVGACNNKGYRSRYSQFGDGLTVVAPSDDVLPPEGGRGSTERLGTLSVATTDVQGLAGYNQDDSLYTRSPNEFGFGGTSAAAAQIAGVVALMLIKNRDLKPIEVVRILRETAGTAYLRTDDDREPARPSDEFGHGLVDAGAAVERA